MEPARAPGQIKLQNDLYTLSSSHGFGHLHFAFRDFNVTICLLAPRNTPETQCGKRVIREVSIKVQSMELDIVYGSILFGLAIALVPFRMTSEMCQRVSS